MAPPRKGRKPLRSDNANENAAGPSNPPVSEGGVTRAELNTVVTELQQQIADQNTLMLEKLTALLAAQSAPAATQRVETNAEGNSHSSLPNRQGNVHVESHHTEVHVDLDEGPPNHNNLNDHGPCHQNNHSQWNRIPQNAGGTTNGAPPREGGQGPSQLFSIACANEHQKKWLAFVLWSHQPKRNTFLE